VSDFLELFARVIPNAVPYVLAALCGVVTERSGLIDLALEAKLLFGAFAAAAIAYATGSLYLGIAAGAVAGAIVAAVQTGFALTLRADQIVVGIGLNIVAFAGTRLLLQLVYHEGANSPQIVGFGSALLANPAVWIAAIAAVAVPFALTRTRWGLRLRAAGDRPDALRAAGVSPARARLWAAMIGGALAGVGGAHLSLRGTGFVSDMSNGRGYMALAMVILAGWRPGIAALACVGVAIAETVSHMLQNAYGREIPPDLVVLLPYVVTLAVLAIFGGRGQPPKALGKIEG